MEGNYNYWDEYKQLKCFCGEDNKIVVPLTKYFQGNVLNLLFLIENILVIHEQSLYCVDKKSKQK